MFFVEHCNIIRVSWDVKEQQLNNRKNGHENFLSVWRHFFVCILSPLCHFLINPSPPFIHNVISYIYLMIVSLHTLFRTKFIVCSFAETFSGLCQTSQMEILTKVVNRRKLHLICFTGFWIGCDFCMLYFSFHSFWKYLMKILELSDENLSWWCWLYLSLRNCSLVKHQISTHITLFMET